MGAIRHMVLVAMLVLGSSVLAPMLGEAGLSPVEGARADGDGNCTAVDPQTGNVTVYPENCIGHP
ncbi:MAG: hypothetical protein LC624_04275 [Halobacteriales archaeon]|nr:hypothetical protein [Halobacteriales archaeon]